MYPIRTSAKAIIIREGKILLNFCETDKEGEFYVCSGGGQELNEALSETIKRECMEEIGAKVEVGELVFVREFCGQGYTKKNNCYLHQVEFYFLCNLANGEEPTLGEGMDDYQKSIEWINIEELDKYKIYPSAVQNWVKGKKIPTYLGIVD